MSAALRRAVFLLTALAAIAVIVWNILPAPGTRPEPEPLASTTGQPAAPVGSDSGQAPGPLAPSVVAAPTRDYAIALDELQGLPPDLPPGTPIEVWVSWDRPSSAAPKLRVVVPRAELVRVVPAVTPGGPVAVVVRLPARRVPDLLWADGYGALSVTVPS